MRLRAIPYRIRQAFRGGWRFIHDLRAYRREAAGETFPLRFADLRPLMSDYSAQARSVDNHYFHQDLWAARKIYGRRPAEHVDIGSRIDGFIAHLLVFMPVTVVDVRPLDSSIEGLRFIRSDA